MATVNEKMTAIADNIRSKTGGTDPLTLDGMANGVDDVYEFGKKSEYDKFWDLFQAKGSRNAYAYAFNNTGDAGWYDEMFYPKYDINVRGNATNMFLYFNAGQSHTAMDLSSRLEECGVTLDTSTTSIFKSMFHNSLISRIPPINISRLTTETNATYMFYGPDIITIDKIILPNEDNDVIGNPKVLAEAVRKHRAIRISGVKPLLRKCLLNKNTAVMSLTLKHIQRTSKTRLVFLIQKKVGLSLRMFTNLLLKEKCLNTCRSL